MLAKKRPVIALDIKLKHYFDPETDKVVGVDRYETDFSYRDRHRYTALFTKSGTRAQQDCRTAWLPPAVGRHSGRKVL